MDLTPTVANGYPRARPVERPELPLDRKLLAVFDKIGHAERLYPDIYVWRLTDAALKQAQQEQERAVSAGADALEGAYSHLTDLTRDDFETMARLALEATEKRDR